MLSPRSRPVTANEPFDRIPAPTSRPSTVPSPRAIASLWRLENATSASPRLQSHINNSIENGPSRIAARLSAAHNAQSKASALAEARGKQLQALQQAQHQGEEQVHALRSAREGLSCAAAELEKKLRAEQQRSAKFKAQYDRASGRARDAAALEATARAEAEAALTEVDRMRMEVADRDALLAAIRVQSSALQRERDAAKVEAATRTTERDASSAALAETRATIAEMESRREGVQRQLEAAKMALVDEREGRRAKEAERLSAVAVAETAVKKLEAAMRQLDREKGVTGDTVKRGKVAEQLQFSAEERSAMLEKEVDEMHAQQRVMIGDQQAGTKRLHELRNAVGEAAAAILVDGERFDPIRIHNERVIAELFEALAISGGEVSKHSWAAKVHQQAQRADAHSGEGAENVSDEVSPPWPSPARQAAARQAQRGSSQHVLDSMRTFEEMTMRQRKKLSQKLIELVAKLQYRGDTPTVRADVVAELLRLADGSNEKGLVPHASPSLVVGAQDIPGEWPPQSRSTPSSLRAR